MYEATEREKKKHANDRIQAKMFNDLKEEKKSMESKSTKATKIMIELYGEGIRSLMMDSYIQKMNRNEET